MCNQSLTSCYHSLIYIADPTCILLPPRITEPLEAGLLTALCAALVTRFDTRGVNVTKVRKHLKNAQIDIWGRVRRIDSDEGDTIRASHVVKSPEDARDATFLRVSTNPIHCEALLIFRLV